ELEPEPEQAPRRDGELDARAVAVPPDVAQLTPALADRRDERTCVLFGAVDDELFVGLQELAGFAGAQDDLRTAERELVSLPPHRLGQDRERELAARENQGRVRLPRFLEANADVSLELR